MAQSTRWKDSLKDPSAPVYPPAKRANMTVRAPESLDAMFLGSLFSINGLSSAPADMEPGTSDFDFDPPSELDKWEDELASNDPNEDSNQ
jgi:hypothetical protein